MSTKETHLWKWYIPSGAKTVIIGTFPPVRRNWSFDFFYPNKNNYFWRVLAALDGQELQYFSGKEAVTERKALLDRLQVGLSDMGQVICRKKDNSMDENLHIVKYMDILQLLDENPSVSKLVFTSSSGKTSAARWFKNYLTMQGIRYKIPKGKRPLRSRLELQGRSVEIVLLYSTSPRVGAMIPFDKLVELFGEVKQKHIKHMRLLLLSNSTIPGEEYLSWAKAEIQTFLGDNPSTAVFIPYAAVSFGYDEYEAKVDKVFSEFGCQITGIHHALDPVQAVENAETIVIGGGNTWRLVQQMHEHQLMEAIRAKVQAGTPYIGWSAGSNVACPSMKTTNDMPIVDPQGMDTLHLIPFQINPHYLDVHPAGHGGETREDRIREFIEINPDVFVLGLREACLLKCEDNVLQLIGSKTARLFRKDCQVRELSSQDDLSFLLESISKEP